MKLAPLLSIVAFAAVLFVICPLALIWAINTLFSQHIPFTIATWFAAAILFYSFSIRSSADKK
jgi:cobalamin biosynthesis protein CobD/CbiB